MLSPTVNTAVLMLLGFILGVFLHLATVLSEPFYAKYKRKRQSWWDRVRTESDAGRDFFFGGSRAAKLVMLAFYGILGVLLATLAWSPLELRWWPFLASVFLGFLAAHGAFTLARTGKLSVNRRTPVDRLFGVTPPAQGPTTRTLS